MTVNVTYKKEKWGAFTAHGRVVSNGDFPSSYVFTPKEDKVCVDLAGGSNYYFVIPDLPLPKAKAEVKRLMNQLKQELEAWRSIEGTDDETYEL